MFTAGGGVREGSVIFMLMPHLHIAQSMVVVLHKYVVVCGFVQAHRFPYTNFKELQ